MYEWLQLIFLGHIHKWEEDSREGGILLLKCSVCGKRKMEPIPGWVDPNKLPCKHPKWETITHGNLVSHKDPHGVPIGHYYDQKCQECGEHRRTTLKG